MEKIFSQYPYVVCLNNEAVHLAKNLKDAYQAASRYADSESVFTPIERINLRLRKRAVVWENEEKVAWLQVSTYYFFIWNYERVFLAKRLKRDSKSMIVFSKLITHNSTDKVLSVHMIKPYISDNYDVKKHLSRDFSLKDPETAQKRLLERKNFILRTEDFNLHMFVSAYELSFLF